jgi:hypothetical protein
MSEQDVAKFVDDLMAKQKVLDAQDAALGAEIVAAHNPKTIDEAKRLAAGWIGTAAQESRNAEYCCRQRDEMRRNVGEQLIELEHLIRDVGPLGCLVGPPSVVERLTSIHATLKKIADGV